ncbi:MAG: ROK family protein, partial [Lysobacterales bacterium]
GHDRQTVYTDLHPATVGGSFPAVLSVDVGGTHVKVMHSVHRERRAFESGPELTPAHMCSGVVELTGDWRYDAVAIGLPGPVRDDAPFANPPNLGPGWVGFDYAAAFGKPVKILNDAAMQALGSYQGGKMLFLGLGTGLGSALVMNGEVVPMELRHLNYRKKQTFEQYVGEAGLDRLGKGKWRKHVLATIKQLRATLMPDEIVIGGGNVRLLKDLPEGCRRGDNDNAFLGGFRLWSGGMAKSVKLPGASP